MTDLKLKSTYITQTSSARLYGLRIPIIGLTGGIATGKSSVSNILQSRGIPLIDADKLVHQIYADSKTITFIQALAPTSITDNKIDFKVLRKLFFTNKEIQKKIEDFIYKELPNAFITALDKFKDPQFIVYDVPLLFEKNLQLALDYTVLVYCEPKIQIDRLLNRDKIDLALAQSILSKQLQIDDKRDMTNYIINNSGSLSELDTQVDAFIEEVFE